MIDNALARRPAGVLVHKDVDWFPDGDNADGFLLNVMRADAAFTPNNEDGLIFGMKLKTLTDHFTTGVNSTIAC